jgi:hypothetical protein
MQEKKTIYNMFAMWSAPMYLVLVL